MSFLNPLFLFGLLAAAIPIIIHLFTRKQPKELRFPSLEFLSEVNQSEIRRVRIKQWLLLLLRTLAVAALALAMSRPALRGTAGTKSGAATTVVALVDRSGSMGARTREGTLVQEAKRVVESLLATLGPQDELLLVPYDVGPDPLTPQPISDVQRLRAAIQSFESAARTTDHARALEFAARALAASRSLNRELFWVSDFQSAGFMVRGAGSGEPAVPAGPWDRARTYLVPLVPGSRANVALTDVALSPVEDGAAVSVTGFAYGAPAGDLAVEVRDQESDTQIGRGFLTMPMNGEASTLLPLTALPSRGGIALIPEDALALDNRRVFAAGRSGTIRVVLREAASPSPLRIALEAGSPASGLAVESVAAADLPARIAEADVLVLHDPERLGANELQTVLDYHRSGGAILVILGERADPTFWSSSILGELGLGTLGDLATAAPGAAWRLRRVAAGHPVLAGFETRPGEPLSAAHFRAVRAFSPRAGTRVLLQFDRAHPALLEAPRAMAFLAPIDPRLTDFPTSGAFLPLFHQAVKVLGRGTAAASLEPGDRYSAPAPTGTWRIEDETGRETPSELVATAGSTRLLSAPLERPGLYRVLQGGALRTSFAVNPDPAESDLAAASEVALVRAFPPGRAQIMRPGADLARRVREARYGRELWSWFLIAALCLLIAETLVARAGMPGGETGTRRAA